MVKKIKIYFSKNNFFKISWLPANWTFLLFQNFNTIFTYTYMKNINASTTRIICFLIKAYFTVIYIIIIIIIICFFRRIIIHLIVNFWNLFLLLLLLLILIILINLILIIIIILILILLLLLILVRINF